MPSVLYRVINYALRSSTAQNRYIYVIMSLLKSAADVVDVATTESALQQCYLDASKTVDVAASNAEAFKSNFVALVKVLSEEGLIAHVPSFNTEKKEEAKKVYGKKLDDWSCDISGEKKNIRTLLTTVLSWRECEE